VLRSLVRIDDRDLLPARCRHSSMGQLIDQWGFGLGLLGRPERCRDGSDNMISRDSLLGLDSFYAESTIQSRSYSITSKRKMRNISGSSVYGGRNQLGCFEESFASACQDPRQNGGPVQFECACPRNMLPVLNKIIAQIEAHRNAER
jgi:hypothetical protein